MPVTLPFTPNAARREHPHGQGVISYEESNAIHREQIFPQLAPDPIRQGNTLSRPARRYVAIMSNRTSDWQYAFSGDFIPNAKSLTQRIMDAGRQMGIRAQGTVGARPNLERPPAVTYGSLFLLRTPTYDVR